MKRVIVPILLLACFSSAALGDAEEGPDSKTPELYITRDFINPHFEAIEKAVIPEGTCGQAVLPIKVDLPRPRAKRLAGATFARPSSLPWIVSLRIPRGEYGNWTLCTGVLIRVSDKKEQSDIVLTTARCNDRDVLGADSDTISLSDLEKNEGLGNESVEENSATKLDVSTSVYLYDIYAVLGAHYQMCSQPDGGCDLPNGAIAVDVEKVVYHPDFDTPEGSYINDIAIVKLVTPVNFTKFIQPICLPEPKAKLTDGTDGILAGWGEDRGPLETIFTGEPAREANALRYMSIPVRAPEECSENKNFSSDAMLCVKYKAGVEEGPCGWDMGIPYFFKEEKGYTLQGIVGHHPYDYCGELSSDTYTRVASFVDWINDEVSRLTSVTDE